MGFTVIPREIKDTAYTKFWGATTCTMGDVKINYCMINGELFTTSLTDLF